MTPFFVVVIGWLVFRSLGWLGVRLLGTWRTAGRFALVAMFLFTGSTHFSPLRHDYLAMIPSPLPRELWMIYVTGALEIFGA